MNYSTLNIMMKIIIFLTYTIITHGNSEECPRYCVCVQQTIRCQNVGFHIIPTIPSIIPHESGGVLQYLTISGNSIPFIANLTFQNLLDLKRLELYSNNIKCIDVNAFINLSKLTGLILRSNNLKYLAPDLFTPIYKLQKLDLSYNQLKYLPFSLEGLIYLKDLLLDGNPLHCPCEIIDLTLSLTYMETVTRVTCQTPNHMKNTNLIDLSRRLRLTLNDTKLLGYETLSNNNNNNFERNRLIQSLPYTLNSNHGHPYWPWTHCPTHDFGGKSPRLLTQSYQCQDTYEPITQSWLSYLDRFYETSITDTKPPIIASELKNIKIVAGEIARFVCQPKVGSTGQIFWIIPSTAKRFIRLHRRRQILEITQVHDYHEGSYTCIYFNSYGHDISEAFLQIIQPIKPIIIDAPPADNNIAHLNSILDLKCVARGLPRPQISWIRNTDSLSRHIVTSDRYIVRDNDFEQFRLPDKYVENFAIYTTDYAILVDNENMETKSVLLVRNVSMEDAHGRYICYVSNRIGSSRVSSVIQVIDDEINQFDLYKQSLQPISETTSTTINQLSSIKNQSSLTKLSTEKIPGDELVKQVIEKARLRIEAAIQKTADRLRNKDQRNSPSDVASLFRQPSLAALELAKAAEVYEAAIDEVTSILRQKHQQQLELDGEDLSGTEKFEYKETDPNSRDALGIKLTSDQLAIIAQLSGCQESQQVDPCSRQLCFHLRYRSVDGTCNNLNNPRWGAALVPFRRLLPPQYENGINTPIGWSPGKLYFGYPKPSARLVSRELLGNATLMTKHAKILEDHQNQLKQKGMMKQNTDENKNSKNDNTNMKQNYADYKQEVGENDSKFDKLFDEDDTTSGMLMQWGQFLDHDLDFTPVDASTSRFSDGLGCNETCVNDPPCFPILIPPNDPRIKHRCIGFARSSATCGSGSTSILLGRPRYREQLNQITAFIDASNVYGSDDFENNELRETVFDEGKMKTGMPTEIGKRLLPFNIRGQVDCQADPKQNFVSCFKAGDHRSNENLGLLSMHTLWVREHNRLADDLRTLNPHWSGDRIYHEARKIVGASMQAITYRNWLPMILGPEGMKLLGPYAGYDDQVNPTISNSFATAAMRFGHTLVPPIVFRLNEKWEPIEQGHLLLHQAFFAPDRLLKDGGMDPIIRGLLYNGVRDRSRKPPLNSELTERLFAMAHELALDLASLNIQRGRDHGLPSYTEYAFSICGLGSSPHPDSFEDLRSRISNPDVLEKLRKVYGHPGNIDLFAGGILEDLLPEARVGPTFACILADQFKRLRSGDRFWYEVPGLFSSAQLTEIQRSGSSLSRIICENADNITEIQHNAFLRPKLKQDLIDCKRIPKLNLALWKECPSVSGYYTVYDHPSFSSSYMTDTGILEINQPTTLHRTRRSVCEDRQSMDSNSCTNSFMNLSDKIQKLESQIEELKTKLKDSKL